MVLSGMQSPDFRTICFSVLSMPTYLDLYVEVMTMCASLGMGELGRMAFDGT
jgi:hypothetical protein